jgi:hypothetical protein
MSDIDITLVYSADKKFITASYRDQKVLILASNGCINATLFCESTNVSLNNYMNKNNLFASTCDILRKELNINVTTISVNSEWQSDVDDYFKGYYLHCYHINNILTFCINDALHMTFSVLLTKLHIKLVIETLKISCRK